MVAKKKNSLSKRSGEWTLSQVRIEMAKPRITASARALNGTPEDNPAPLADNGPSDPQPH
jgi:hypothetical protein